MFYMYSNKSDDDKSFEGNIAPTLGFVFPLNEHIKLFGDGLLEIGHFHGLSGLIAGPVTPGFDVGIAFWWEDVNGDGMNMNLGFDIKYRGTWYENYYLHGIGIVITWRWLIGKTWKWW